jgi:uncharacterized membrane protein SirB2
MIAFYPQVKLLHIVCVIASGALFALRGVLVLGHVGAGRHFALRWLSYVIDSTLLTAAFMLMSMLHLSPLAQPWLAVKVLLLFVYVALGYFALHGAIARRARTACFVTAVAVYLFIASVAYRHDPLGAVGMILQWR